ncbi:transaldolase [Acidihalobacter yilgarnensis]|uniref:Transaldolase n=1 Tax=Acidihalobacter yilgarnensis TaxID=2819280 RepID=A0A1D8INM9_9GAMM|nr:transaldolase [Acidihalobacter yilgarnensis]AOU98080.1 transaldolase [Acidihalobacter yilgarnensis]
MNSTQKLHDLGQSIWLDNITRELLTSGILAGYIRDLQVTGLTSNPTIFEHAIGHSTAYDAAIRSQSDNDKSDESLFFDLALEDLSQAADLFRPTFDASAGVDGWVSLEVSPLLAHDAAKTLKEAAELHARANRPNLFIKIPGTTEGLVAIEASIFAGVPVNVTLLFSCKQYLAAAKAYLRGIERRIEAGLDANVGSVASLFISRWDVAVKDTVSPQSRNRLGIAVAMQTYQAYCDLLASSRWQALAAAGASAQRVLWASTGTKDPQASDTLYVEALAAPHTINTIPEKTLLAFADHGQAKQVLPMDGGEAGAVLADFDRQGIDIDVLAERLQREGAEAFVASWRQLLQAIGTKAAHLARSSAS